MVQSRVWSEGEGGERCLMDGWKEGQTEEKMEEEEGVFADRKEGWG